MPRQQGGIGYLGNAFLGLNLEFLMVTYKANSLNLIDFDKRI
jgi:hypothetical protein